MGLSSDSDGACFAVSSFIIWVGSGRMPRLAVRSILESCLSSGCCAACTNSSAEDEEEDSC